MACSGCVAIPSALRSSFGRLENLVYALEITSAAFLYGAIQAFHISRFSMKTPLMVGDDILVSNVFQCL